MIEHVDRRKLIQHVEYEVVMLRWLSQHALRREIVGPQSQITSLTPAPTRRL
jgi:hypothetical protein